MALQTLVVHPVLDGLETQLQPRRQMLKEKKKENYNLVKQKKHFITKNNKKAYF